MSIFRNYLNKLLIESQIKEVHYNTLFFDYFAEIDNKDREDILYRYNITA